MFTHTLAIIYTIYVHMSGEKNSPESCRKFDSSENEKSTKKKKHTEGSDQISLDVTPRFKSITRSKYRIRDF
jgi:hypothetical protein